MPVIDTIVAAVEPETTEPVPLLVDRLLSTAEATGFFGCHARTLHRWRQRGLIGAARVGRTVFYVGADIDALIRGRLTEDVLRASSASRLRRSERG